MPFGMSGSIMQGGVGSGRSSEPAVAPVVNISDPVPTSGVAGTVVIDWTITYTGTVTSADISSGSTSANGIGRAWHSSTTSGAAQGTWSLINPTATDGTAKIRFTSSDGSGGFVRVLMLANAAYNGALGSAQTAWNTPNASVSATPPAAYINNLINDGGSVSGVSTHTWDCSFSSWADTFSVVVGDLDTTGTTAAGTWSVTDGTTSTPDVVFTSSGNVGGVAKFKLKAGSAQSSGVENTVSTISYTATITATPPIVTISGPTPTSVAHDATASWSVTYSSFATSYALTTSLLTTTGSAGFWSVLNGTTSTPTVSFTPSSGTTATYFSVQAGAALNGTVNNTPSGNSTAVTVTEK